MAEKIYIHYGSDTFKPELVTKKKNNHSNAIPKPDFGLWASPVETSYGWKDFSMEGRNYSKSFKFILNEYAKVLTIRSENDILPYIEKNPLLPNIFSHRANKTTMFDTINFDRIINDGYNAIELVITDDWSMHGGVFNSWDCDCIVIFNPDIIKVIDC